MKVLVATGNYAKIEGAKRALAHYFENFTIEGITSPSNVSEQPVNEEITKGAKNRVKNLKEYCKKNKIQADLYLSIESGINNFFGDWIITNIAIIEDNNDFYSIGSSCSFPVPQKYVSKIIESDLNTVMNEIFIKDNERSTHGGGIQLLTHGEMSRIDITEHAFIMALTKYINKNWN